jgi:hypothetical protein
MLLNTKCWEQLFKQPLIGFSLNFTSLVFPLTRCPKQYLAPRHSKLVAWKKVIRPHDISCDPLHFLFKHPSPCSHSLVLWPPASLPTTLEDFCFFLAYVKCPAPQEFIAKGEWLGKSQGSLSLVLLTCEVGTTHDILKIGDTQTFCIFKVTYLL